MRTTRKKGSSGRSAGTTDSHRFQAQLTREAGRLLALEARARRASSATPVAASPPPPPLVWPSMATPEQRAYDYYLDERAGVHWQTLRPLTQPWPHQVASMDALARAEETAWEGARGAVLADAPGAGKTLTVCAHLLRDLQRRVAAGEPRFGRPTLAVVPKRLLGQWVRQIDEHLPPGSLNYMVARPAMGQRASDVILDADMHRIRFCVDLVITTYETLRRAMTVALAEEATGEPGGGADDDDDDEESEEDEEELGRRLAAAAAADAAARQRGLFGIEFHRLVADEAVYIKNAETSNFAAVQWIRAPCRLFITATPVPNARVGELNALLRSLGCRRLLTATEAGATTAPADADGVVAEDVRQRIIRRFFINTPIPPEHQRPRLHPRTEWLSFRTGAEQEAYAAAAEHVEAEMKAGRLNGLQSIVFLRMLCLSPMFGLDLGDAEARATWCAAHPYRPAASKMAFVVDYVRRVMRPRERALVFCEWVGPLEEMAHHLRRAGIPYRMMHGRMNDADAAEAYEAFCHTPDDMDDDDDGPAPPGLVRVLLLTGVAAVGLDGLQCANHVLSLTPTWSPGADEQLGGRINRPGQRHAQLTFLKLVLAGTIEEFVNKVNWAKEATQTALLRDAAAFALPVPGQHQDMMDM